ncbi:CapA family protein [Brevibacillus massiliensis]|uniref:CapA family protein n=1 Tax=Brevibacillus massiliensis TaxID=1118054 RepID=UPI0002DD54E7|nr:CapA family protein [Brevibacillus massiliensis]
MNAGKIIAVVLACLILTGCAVPASVGTEAAPAPQTAVPADPETSPELPDPLPVSDLEQAETAPQADQWLTLMAVGDIMVHDEQLQAAWDEQRKSYDFTPSFAKVIPFFQEADILIGNLETTMAGKERRYTGYPEFNSPETLAETLKQVGFTAVTTANNHSLDRREAGVLHTLDVLDQVGLPHTGTFRNAEQRNEPLILEKNGIRIGVLAYTYGTNGIPLPEGKPYLVNLYDPALLEGDVARARELGADVVAVALHFGVEYQRMPNPIQREWVDQCFAAGVDIVLGSHPHVVQPYEWRTVTGADGAERKVFAIYSLGNFISAQRGDYKDAGVILQLVLHKGTDGRTAVEEAKVIPTYVHFYRTGGKRNYVIYPLPHTQEAVGQNRQETHLTPQVLQKMDSIYKEIQRHVESLQPKEKAS